MPDDAEVARLLEAITAAKRAQSEAMTARSHAEDAVEQARNAVRRAAVQVDEAIVAAAQAGAHPAEIADAAGYVNVRGILRVLRAHGVEDG